MQQQWLINNSSQLNMFRAIILPNFRSTRLCVTACGIMHPRCCRPPAGNICLSWQYHYYRQSTSKKSTAWLQTVFKEPKEEMCLEEINFSRFIGSLCELWTLSYKTLHPTLKNCINIHLKICLILSNSYDKHLCPSSSLKQVIANE